MLLKEHVDALIPRQFFWTQADACVSLLPPMLGKKLASAIWNVGDNLASGRIMAGDLVQGIV